MSDSEDFMMEESEIEEDFDSEEEENMPVVKKKAAAGKLGGVKPKGASKTTASTVTKKSTKSVEERYQKKTQLEHILLRPDTYIGSVERVSQPMYVLQGNKIVEREITFTPGLYKIFDEIVVNAADNKQRDPNMDKLEIVVDPTSNMISVKNNGAGIPVVLHKDHNCYVPTMIFGQLLTGSNFDDNEKKTTGGRNGYGAKLANVFSTKFVVECHSTEYGKAFRQVFRDNMTVTEEPIVKNLTAAEKKKGDFVKISFSPDLQRFGMTELDEDAVGLLSKRAYDIAGSMAMSPGKKLTVTLNGEKLKIKNFKEYLDYFSGIDPPVAYEKGERWEVGVASSPDQTPRNISFVNSICTSKGGQHVTYIADQVASHLVKFLKKKNKGGSEIKATQVKNNLTIFVNCLIENPSFDSQTKEFMTTKPKAFGSKFELPTKFLKAIEKSEVVDQILSQAERKMNAALKRKGGVKKSKLTGIPKLDDANFAGTAKSLDCTLIITEGDSAKTLAMSGISVVGRDYYGVFPLKGKILNVRDATKAQVANNSEIKNLVDILGLKYGVEYNESTVKTLRYGHLMIMCDQDVDGSHIKALVINFIHKFWPSLLDVPGFLQQFITPIVKVTKGKKSLSFFNLPEYEQWREATTNNGKGYKAKYYKGLGTSTSAEAKEYFSNLDKHEIWFHRLSVDKGEQGEDEMIDALPDVTRSGDDLIDMIFRKTRVEDRKGWLNAFEKDTYLDYSEAVSNGGVKYSDFINREFILFAKYDNERSLPSLIDGLKPSQRKVLFGCFKRKLSGEVKVAQLTGYIAEQSAYHHGETSLQGTIVNMAQDFVGSNNINLLTPSGQFGTRLMGGKDAASPRYIFTKLEPITRAIFHPDDDDLLSYLQDDGLSIEPEFYMPVIPMILVNGADGIGTGWSTNVPNYNPRDVISNLRRMIAGEDPVAMVPFYSGYTGSITPKDSSGGFEVRGKIERVNDTTLLVTELALKKWTQDYKHFVEKLLTGDDKSPAEIKDFKENHTDTTVSFTITADKSKIDEFEKEKNGLYGKFKLTGSLSTTNMHLFDSEGKICKYDSPLDIMASFYQLRCDFYVKRKDKLVNNLQAEKLILSNKARFVEEVCSGELVVSKRKRSEILSDLQERGYYVQHKQVTEKNVAEIDEDGQEDEEQSSSDAELAKGYEYLLGMKIWSLTLEKAEALRKQLEEKTQELTMLQATTPSQIWLNDLDAIEEALDVRDSEIEKARETEKKAQRKSQKRNTMKAKTTKKKTAARRKDEWDSDLESSSDDAMDVISVSEDESLPKPRQVVKAKKPPALKKAAATKKPPASKVVATKPKAAPAPSIAPSTKDHPMKDTESDSDDDVSSSLMERMKRKLVVSPQTKSASFISRPKAPLRPSPRHLDSDDDAEQSKALSSLEASAFKPASLTPAKKAPTKTKGPLKRVTNTTGNKQGGAETQKGKGAKKKDSSEDTDSSGQFAFDDDSDAFDDSPIAKKPVPAARSRRARVTSQRVTYNIEDSSDDESFYS